MGSGRSSRGLQRLLPMKNAGRADCRPARGAARAPETSGQFFRRRPDFWRTSPTDAEPHRAGMLAQQAGCSGVPPSERLPRTGDGRAAGFQSGVIWTWSVTCRPCLYFLSEITCGGLSMLTASRPARPGGETILSTGRPGLSRAPVLARHFRLVGGNTYVGAACARGCGKARRGARPCGEIFCRSA